MQSHLIQTDNAIYLYLRRGFFVCVIIGRANRVIYLISCIMKVTRNCVFIWKILFEPGTDLNANQPHSLLQDLKAEQSRCREYFISLISLCICTDFHWISRHDGHHHRSFNEYLQIRIQFAICMNIERMAKFSFNSDQRLPLR